MSIGGIIIRDIFKDNMNSDKYVEILKNKFLNIYNKNKNYTCQQDNSPIHTSSK